MIDGIKILNLPVIIDKLLKNDLLQFPNAITDDGEVLNKPRHAEYRSLLFTIKNNNVKLKGSLHKYFNSGLHNYNNFYFSNLLNTLIDLFEKFKINPNTTVLNNVEFGVNIFTPFPPEVLLNAIIHYKGTPFHPFNINGAKGIECEKENFIIKIYDKSHQYNLPEYILRFEIKAIRMKFFVDNRAKINVLSDLLNIDNLIKLKTILIAGFDEILIYDNSIKENKLNATERLILSNGRNSKHWEELKPKSKEFGNNKNLYYRRTRKKYYRELERFKKIISKYSTSTLQKDISFLIESKFNELLIFDKATGDKLTNFLKQISFEDRDKFTDYINSQKNSEKGQITNLHIERICPPDEVKTIRKCLTCGIDISHKREIAKYCSKKCKNDFTNPLLNPKNNLKRSIEKINLYPSLFDNSLYILLSNEKIKILNKKNSIYN